MKLLPTLVALLFTAGAALAQNVATYATYGSGCLGSNGTPTTSASTLPEFGRKLTLQLSNAKPNAQGFLTLGFSDQLWGGIPLPFDMGLIGATGCDVLAAIDLAIPVTTSATGTASREVRIPNDPKFLGTHLYNQWLVADAVNFLGLVASNGGDAEIGTEPQVTVGSFTSQASADTEIEIRGQHFGTNPDDWCIRAFDAGNNDGLLFRGTQITREAGQDVLRARIASVGPRFQTGTLQMMRGKSRNPAVLGTAHLSAPGAQWGWDGVALPENEVVLGPFTLLRGAAPEVNCTYYWTKNGNELEVVFPLKDPCDGNCDGLNTTAPDAWSLLTRIKTDPHFDITCSSGRRHYDDFLEAVTVIDSLNFGGAAVGTEHASQLGEVFDAKYGVAGPFTFGAEMISMTHARMFVRPDPGCTLEVGGGYYGKMIVDCPERNEVFVLRQEDILKPVEVGRWNGSAPMLTTLTSLPAAPHTAIDFDSSPDGTQAVVITNDGSPNPRLWLCDAESSARFGIVLPATFMDARVEVSAQDYAVVYSTSGSTQIYVVDLQLLTVAPALTLPTPVNVVGVSPSGSYLLAGSTGNDQIYLIHLSGTGVLTTVGTPETNPNGASWQLAWSPNNRSLAVGAEVVTTGAGASITKYDLILDVQQKPIQVVRDTSLVIGAGQDRVQALTFSENGQRLFVEVAPLFSAQWELWDIRLPFFTPVGGAAFSQGEVCLALSPHWLALTNRGATLMVLDGNEVHAFTVLDAGGANLRPTSPSATITVATGGFFAGSGRRIAKRER